jgi:PadR family transcriptional regulator PadR
MAKQDSLQGALDLLILKILSRRAPLHGYAIMAAIVEVSGDVLRVEEGSLYPALHRLEEDGSLKARWINREDGRRSRVYDLTAAGRKRLSAETERWTATSAAIHHVLRMA